MQQEFTKEINKAEILVEALGYMQKYEGDIVVIKYGGSAMTNETISAISKVSQSVTLKPFLNSLLICTRSNILLMSLPPPCTIIGFNPTDCDTLEIAEMVLSGKVNKGLVTHLEQIGTHAVGLSGKDGNMITVEKVMPQGEDIGYVGKITKVDTTLINALLEQGYTPIISTIGLDEKYHAYNINADDVATAIARAVKASKLVFLTDIEGVLQDPNNPNTLISKIDTASAKELFENGVITGGMIPKLKNCLEAVQNDVKRVHILDGRLEHSLLIEIFTKKGVGTMIKK